jgi:hypothetical protein
MPSRDFDTINDVVRARLSALPKTPQPPPPPEPHSCCANHFLTYFQDYLSDSFGQIFLTGILDIRPYRKAHVEILQFPSNVPNLNVSVVMGKISGWTLAQKIDQFPLGSGGTPKIMSYDVVGPDMSVYIDGGPPDTPVSIQAWVFLH